MNPIGPSIRKPGDDTPNGTLTRPPVTTIILIMLVIMIIIDKFVSWRRAAAHSSSP
jgi:hypothetical protein